MRITTNGNLVGESSLMSHKNQYTGQKPMLGNLTRHASATELSVFVSFSNKPVFYDNTRL